EINADAGASHPRTHLPAQPAFAAADIEQPLRRARGDSRDDRRVRARPAAGDETIAHRPRPVGGIRGPGAFEVGGVGHRLWLLSRPAHSIVMVVLGTTIHALLWASPIHRRQTRGCQGRALA